MRNTSIAENIAAGRRELGVTQAALAERVGVTKAAVSKWEKGPRRQSIDSGRCRAFGHRADTRVHGPAGLRVRGPGGCPYPGSPRWREGAPSQRACGVGY